MDKPEALFLADELEAPLGTIIGAELYQRAAAELRRLHAENERLSATVKAREDEILTHSEAFYEATRLLSEEREKNERLLEALKLARRYISVRTMDGYHAEIRVDAAIKAVEGEKT